jgi:hypothetical protein
MLRTVGTQDAIHERGSLVCLARAASTAARQEARGAAKVVGTAAPGQESPGLAESGEGVWLGKGG